MNNIEEQLRIINERLELLEKMALATSHWTYRKIRNKVDCQDNRDIDRLYAETFPCDK